MSYNDPLNKTDPLGLRPLDDAFDVCLDPDESQVLTPGELQGYPYDLGFTTSYSEWLAQVVNCASTELNGDTRTGGSFIDHGIGCAKAMGASALTSELSLWSLMRGCGSAKYWQFFAADVGIDLASPGNVGEQNAVRHFVWSALIAYESGRDAAIAVTGIHEVEGLSCPGTPRECDWDDAADLTNNRLGAAWGQAMKSAGRYGNRFQCLNAPAEWGCGAGGWKGDEIRRDVREAARTQLTAGALDLRGGCPSTARVIRSGC